MAINWQEIENKIRDSYELPNNVLNAVSAPVVTIRTSTYQHAPFIKDCIEGVLMQETDFPIELIIGEDFSTDGTREIVFEYAEKYPDIIRVITAGYNVGSKANGQRCIRAARGMYLAICEGDDYWKDPKKLQKQVDFLNNNFEYAGVGCYNETFIYKNDEIKRKIIPDKINFRSYNLSDFLRTGTPGTRSLNMLFRNDSGYKGMSKKGVFDTEANGDRMRISYLLKNLGDIALLPFVGSVYRVHPKGASGGLKRGQIRNEIKRNYKGVMEKILTARDEKSQLWKKNLKSTWKSDLKNMRIKSIIEDYRIYRSSVKN